MTELKKGLFILVAAVSAAHPAMAGHSCWVSEVTLLSPESVIIDFVRPVNVVVTHTDGSLTNYDTAPAGSGASGSSPTESSVPAKLGEELQPIGDIHSGCIIKVVRESGQIGLRTEAFRTPVPLPPGFPPESPESLHSTEFIAARAQNSR